MHALPELISNINWMLSNPIDLKSLRGDIWAWASVPQIKEVLHELLSLLKMHRVAATFFVSGVCAQQNKDEVLRITDAGHEIGLHGYRHVPYDMPSGGVTRDMSQAMSVFQDMGVAIDGFRAPWLIANEETYYAAQMLGLTYVSNISSKSALQRVDKYNLVELPIYLDDQSLMQGNAVEALLESSRKGRVFEFHLLYVRQKMRVLDEFLKKLKMEAMPLSKIAAGGNGLGLSFDIAYLNRLELVKKLFS